MSVQVIQASLFAKQVKRLHVTQKSDLDDAIIKVMKDPRIGDMKKGDLSGVYVYKFRMSNQLTLLAYHWYAFKKQLLLLSVGPHENFYRDLKR